MLDELGLHTPAQLRAFITKRSLPVLGMSFLETALNAAGSYAAVMLFILLPWDAAVLIDKGVWPSVAAVMTGFGQGLAALSAFVFATNAIFSSVTFFATLYATLGFDINARAFLQSVQRRSGGVGMGAWDAPGRAAASLDVLRQLQRMHDMLLHRAAQRASVPPSGSLAVHLATLAERGTGGRGLGLAALSLAPAEVATLSRLFVRFDADGDDKLDASELRAMMRELTPDKEVSEEAATAALRLLDVDGDGLVELDEFAAWYGSSRLWHRGGGELLANEEMRREEQEARSLEDAVAQEARPTGEAQKKQA